MGPTRWHRPQFAMRMRGRLGDGQMLDRPLLMAFRRLNLTDQQWDRVQAVLEVQQLRRGADGTPQQRRAQVQALFDPGDSHHAEAVQAIKDRAVARIDQAAHAQEALYEVLTPAQKARLQQLATQRRERTRARLQQRGAQRGGAQQSGQTGAETGASTSGQ
jgi:Spy/CpxP family protein refolding chaperone